MKNTYKKGAAMITFILFFTFATGAIMLSLGRSMFSDLSDYNHLIRAKQSLFIAESLIEDVVYRRTFGTFSIDNVETLTIGQSVANSITTYDSAADTFTIDSSATLGSTVRKARAIMTIGAGSAFNYGLQAGNGGITLANGSSVIGNIYANGEIRGTNSNPVITGDAVSAGLGGLVKGVKVNGSVYADTIDGIDADGDAYYNTQIGTDAQNPVGGTRNTPSPNQPLADFPIPPEVIDEWKQAILDNGTVIAAADPLCSSGTYTIDASVNIGYLKVECDVDIKKTGAATVVTLTGPIWVAGNLSFTQGPTIKVDPSLGRRSVQMIADNPSDRLTSSKIEVRNSTEFIGSGDSRSYIMLLSMNESASVGGSEPAIDVSQSANGSVVTYADAGLVDIGNGIDLRSVTGYQINVAQNSEVIYEVGLTSLLFTSGPGGAYILEDWRQWE